jgi:hypothetical protein
MQRRELLDRELPTSETRMTNAAARLRHAFILIAAGLAIAGCARGPQMGPAPRSWPEVWPVTEMPLDAPPKGSTDDSEMPTARPVTTESLCWYEAPQPIAAPCPKRMLQPERF